MLQPTVNLHFVGYTLDHASFVHGLLVNLQNGTMMIIIYPGDVGVADESDRNRPGTP